jgi:hypothetical protein
LDDGAQVRWLGIFGHRPSGAGAAVSEDAKGAAGGPLVQSFMQNMAGVLVLLLLTSSALVCCSGPSPVSASGDPTDASARGDVAASPDAEATGDSNGPSVDGGVASDGAPGDDGGGASCALPAGTYTIHYTNDPSSSQACPTVPDKTVQSDGVLHGPGTGCTQRTQHVDATCTITIHCDLSRTGVSDVEDITEHVVGDGITGTVHEVLVVAGTTADCKAAFVWTKQ